MTRLNAIGFLAALTLVLNATGAQAAAAYCAAGVPTSDGLSLSDATFRGNNADDCYGVHLEEGGLSLTSINTLWSGLYGGGDFGFPIEANEAGVTLSGITFDFDLVGEDTATSGTWVLNVTPNVVGAPYPQTVDMLLVLENERSGTDQWAMYLFDDETFTDGTDGPGTWMISFLSNGSKPKLDEAILYFRNGTPPDPGTGAGSGQAVIPEPASLLLLGSGLAAAATRARRRSRAAEKP